ncbi:tRNA (guanosine(37)-N1)-methyltransferase TrmD [Alicyclobacillus macrosporangiidus]|uniref:tRNA (guanosine(37)-N1)-methyltransferase TrmD n=1 Tax=Alicyclobacillus macrosporangiidus TaxID=392015 RepID=UPI001587F343|nr:tRNA (guanosine(37)-N1)-methyltransferase TrmD [Alicyclobacillus macrosporangiidus]
MRVAVLTLFPEMFTGVLGASILKRALEQGQLAVELVNFRDFATDRHRTVDDYPFGGGAGMLLKPGPLFDAVEAVRSRMPGGCPRVLLMSPQGRVLTQGLVQELAREREWMVLCGHYEGFDERVREHLVTDEISLGDFVLTGGEIAAMALLDAVARLLPGVLGNQASAHDESFSAGLLEYPQYTRPAVFRDWAVPPTLLSGHHQKIAEWRHVHALYRTWARRPDLLRGYPLTDADRRWIARWEQGDFSGIDVLEPQHRAERM